jgi:predicted Zn-dependent protease
VLERELGRHLGRWKEAAVEPPVHYLSYDIAAVEELWLEAARGELVRDDLDRDRSLDVDVRVGTPELDNSRSLGGDYGPGNGLGTGLSVALADDELSVAQGLWLATERQYRDAVTALAEIETSQALRTSDEARHPDFSGEKPTRWVEAPPILDLPAVSRAWRPALREASRVLAADPAVLESRVVLIATLETHHRVDSEGSRVQTGQTRVRLLLEAQGQAEDGMRLFRTETFDVHAPPELPTAAQVVAVAERLRVELLKLRAAPVAEPFAGPAVLEGRAAAVFFHEIFGHRLEGHRQKDDLEGQTFTDRIGKRVLPAFLDVVDDPTLEALGGTPLSGMYAVDDEGVPARRTVLVDRGKLATFLLDRSPVLPFVHSNGHGRRERGHQVVARQGNLIVSSRRTLRREQLRQALLDEVRRQRKPYGLWFTEVEGGYTVTDRSGPQAFKVMPLMVYRVFADGRPDELVRGADIVGTPLSAFETILATDDRPGVFNGVCGAESGWVPVSAVSPSILLRNLEIERAAHDRDRPPLLPPPPGGGS